VLFLYMPMHARETRPEEAARWLTTRPNCGLNIVTRR
jgi:hypothetical protein